MWFIVCPMHCASSSIGKTINSVTTFCDVVCRCLASGRGHH